MSTKGACGRKRVGWVARGPEGASESHVGCADSAVEEPPRRLLDGAGAGEGSEQLLEVFDLAVFLSSGLAPACAGPTPYAEA